MLSDLMTGLCDYLNIDALEPDSSGVYVVVFDGDLTVEVTSLSSSLLVVRSSLAELPDEARERDAKLKEYLQGNMLLLREQSNSLSLDEEGKSIWLHRMLRSDVSVSDFCECLSAFVVTLEWWNKRGQASSSSMPLMDVMPQHFVRP